MTRKQSIYGVVRNEDATPETVEVARKRILPHLMHMNLVEWNLETLAVNCYLQGVRDLAETLISRGMVLSVEEVLLDYQI